MAAIIAGLKCYFSQLQAALGKYCVYLLADYITLAAAPPLDNRSVSSVGAGDSPLEALAGAPANALRQGALALYGACSPAEVSRAANITRATHCVAATPQTSGSVSPETMCMGCGMGWHGMLA